MFGGQSFNGFGQQAQQGTNPGAQPNAGGGMFGQSTAAPSFGNAFGQSTNTTPAFGASQPNTTFGQQPNTQQQQPSSFGFGQSTSNTFGAPKPATSFGAFGASTAAPPAPASTPFGFGAPQQPAQTGAFGSTGTPAFNATGTNSFFGQQNAAPPSNTFNAFGGGGMPGQSSVTQGTATVPYAPFREDATPNEPKQHAKSWDVHQSIVSMPAYAGLSPEELRVQDYNQGRQKGTGAPGAPAPGGMNSFGFGAQQQPAQSTPAFGQQQQQPQAPSGGLFGQPQQPAQSGLFGQQPAAPSSFGAQPSSGLFGAAKPATGFGAANPAPTPFGQQQPQQPSGGLFGANNAQTQPNQAQSSFQFGQNNQGQSTQPTSGFGFGGANSQPPKPSFGTGFGAQPQQPQQQQPGSQFSFGAQPSTSAPTGSTFGANNAAPSSGFSFGANNTQPKPAGGLFGNTAGTQPSSTPSFGGFGANTGSSTPAAQPAKPGVSFGGFGAPAAPSAPSAPSGSGFGASTSGGLFGAKPAAPSGGSGFGFGQSASQPNTLGAPQAPSGGLFGAKPATGGASGGLFGAPATSNTNAPFGQAQQPSGGLFGAQPAQQQQQQAPGGLFGGQGATAKPSFSFGGANNAPTGSSLFGQSQPAQGSSGLFGGGGGFGASMNKPLGASAPGAPSSGAAASPASLTSNPYGTDALLANTAPSAASQPPLPFNVAAKNKPPLVSPFRSSPRNAVRVTRLRGSTPGLDLSPRLREGTSGFRESTPGLGAARHGTPARSSSVLFRGPSDAQLLSPQAFIPRSTSKRLVLEGDTSFGRSTSVRRDATPLRSTPRPQFSPAVERKMDQSALLDESYASFAPPLDRGSVVERAPEPVPRASSPVAPQHGDYVLSPTLAELRAMDYTQLASVPAVSVRRIGFGEVAFLEPVDLTSLPDLGSIAGGVVQLRAKECFVYPQEDDLESDRPLDGLQPGYVPVPKAPLGTGLNVPARVSLEGCWPLDRATREPLTDAALPRVKQHITKLKNKRETDFVSYEPLSGTWTFTVQHFSRYGLDESDSDEDEVPAMQLGEEGSESGSSDMHETELLPTEPDVWVPTPKDVRRSATPSVARLESPAPTALPRKVQVMRASFFGHTPPSQGPAAGVSWGPTAYAPTPPVEEESEESEEAPSDDEIVLDEVRPDPIPVARVPLTASVLDRGLFAADPGLTFGRSFRPGWGAKATLVHNGDLHSPSLPSLSEVVMDHVRIVPASASAEALGWATALLQHQRAASDIQVEQGVPLAVPKPGTNFATHAQHYAPDDKRYYPQFFHLGSALFDPLTLALPDEAPASLAASAERLRRKHAFSQWLTRAVAGTVQTEARAHRAASRRPELVFSLLSGFQVEQASDAAVDANDVRLAMLVAQAGGDDMSKAYIREQLDVWRREDVLPHISSPMRRVYELLCGHVGDEANIAAGLDWRRALGLHVWYGVPWEAPLLDSVVSYERALRTPSETPAPLPAYCDAPHLDAYERAQRAQRPDADRDAMYEMVQLQVSADYPLGHVLNARNFGASATEHTLSWHTYITLSHALGVREFEDPTQGEQLTLAYADQLEAQGVWHWAAFVLLHLAVPDVRRRALNALLERNVALLEEHAAFLDALAIPATWRAAAVALAARASGDAYREYQYWLKAEDLSAAHSVAVARLAPEAVVRGEPSLLLQLFRPFGEVKQEALAEGRPFVVANWNTAGRALLDYATLPGLLPPLLAKAATGALTSGEHHTLQKAIQRTHELLEAVPQLYSPSSTQLMVTVARSEMLGVLHNLARLVATHVGAPELRLSWSPTHPPEVEQLQSAASDFGEAMLASL